MILNIDISEVHTTMLCQHYGAQTINRFLQVPIPICDQVIVPMLFCQLFTGIG